MVSANAVELDMSLEAQPHISTNAAAVDAILIGCGATQGRFCHRNEGLSAMANLMWKTGKLARKVMG